MSEENGYSGHTVLLSFLLGAVSGAAAVLLIAPQTRNESADRIREFSQDVKERANDYLGQAKDKVNTTISRSREYLDEKRSLIQSAVEAGKEAYQREKGKPAPEA